MNNVQWTRGELKDRSKSVLRVHYWRIVLVALFLSAFWGNDQIVSGIIDPISTHHAGSLFRESEDVTVTYDDFKEESSAFGEKLDQNIYHVGRRALEITRIIAVVIIGAALFLVAILVATFILNPLYVGCMRFFNRSFDTLPKFKELFHVFENKYKNVVCIMFLKSLYTALWALLFVIPGIVKSYEYSMVPYILSENPELDANEVFAISKSMMTGHKWNSFILDLSFIGWYILSGITFGIVGIFFVSPYSYLTHTALYRKLKGMDSIPQNIYYDGMPLDTENTRRGW